MDREIFNPQTGKYLHTDSEGKTHEYSLGDLCFKDDKHGLSFSSNVDWCRQIIIDADSITFRAGEFELKVTNDRLMDEINHTDKITINGISFIKEN